MSFDRGSVGFTMFALSSPLPGDMARRLAAEAPPPLSTLQEQEMFGWVGGRHLLDLPVTEDNARFGGYLRVTLLSAERKIPPALFRTHVALEEIAWMKDRGKPFVPRRERAQIRADVRKRLLPDMPPRLKGIQAVFDETAGMAFAEATTPAQRDLLRAHTLRAAGVDLVALTPATAAARRGIDVRDWAPASFAPKAPADRVRNDPGCDFLTWLLFSLEARGGVFRDAEHGEFAVSLDGPMVFAMEGEGAHETILRKGAPRFSAEARTCLESGKKLRQARLALGRPEETWSWTFDAETFAFRGMRIPEGDEPAADPAGRFQDRILRLAVFRDVFLRLYDRFADERRDAARWESCVGEMREWIRSRPARR